MSDPQFWIAVASAEHVRRGRAQGFAQVCRGRRAPLARIRPGDGLVYYSPTERFGGKDRFQTFTALGFARAGDPYIVDMGGGFRPFRRDVDWAETSETPIRPLLGELDFTARRDWGYRLRFGLFAIVERDFTRIRAAMTMRAQPDGSFERALAAGAL